VEARLREQGRAAGIRFDFRAETHWQPVDSQRLLLWAARFGKQESFMSALSRRHFEQGGQGESASTRATLMAAAAEAGLDVAAAKSFLETDELVKEVWHSYGATIHQKGIHSIPLFVFNVPQLGLVGGPFRQGAGTPFVVNGSMDAPTFLRIFEGVYELFCQAAPQLGRRFDPESPFAPARRTDKASSVTRRTSSSGRHTKAASEDIVKDLITTDGDALVGCSVLLHGLTARSDLNGKVSRWSTTILFSQPEEYVALMAALYSTGGDSNGARSRSRALSSATHWRRPGQGAAALRQPAGLNHGCRFENTRARQGSGQGGCDRRRAATPFASTTGSRNHS